MRKSAAPGRVLHNDLPGAAAEDTNDRGEGTMIGVDENVTVQKNMPAYT
jgi:hypothetical protein